MKEKPHSYYEWVRYDLLALLPKAVSLDHVLDVGCGAGVTGEVLKKEYGAKYVIGLEVDARAAQEAQRRLDEVIVGSVEREDLPFQVEQFDLILMGDVLEHLIDPWKALSRLVRYLKPDGLVLISLPNIQHWRTAMQLLRGRWEYTAGGTLDQTHLRFFTIKSIKKLFIKSGLNVTKIRYNMGPETRIVNFATFGLFKGFLVYQVLIQAKKTNQAVE